MLLLDLLGFLIISREGGGGGAWSSPSFDRTPSSAWEIGYAYARGLTIIGLRTDFRQAGDMAHSVANAMIECSCSRIFRSADELLEALTG